MPKATRRSIPDLAAAERAAALDRIEFGVVRPDTQRDLDNAHRVDEIKRRLPSNVGRSAEQR